MAAVLAQGFADTVFDAQSVFRATLNALSRPGRLVLIDVELAPPPPLTPELAAVALAFADPDAPVWLDAPLAASAEVARFLRFHTGARLVGDPGEAAFALVSDPRHLPDLAAFATGSEEYPDRSTTVVLAVRSLTTGAPITITGPGIKELVEIRAEPLPDGIVARLQANNALFPRGVDLLFVCDGQVAALPRSSRVKDS